MMNRTYINALATSIAWRAPTDMNNNSIINRAGTGVHG